VNGGRCAYFDHHDGRWYECGPCHPAMGDARALAHPTMQIGGILDLLNPFALGKSLASSDTGTRAGWIAIAVIAAGSLGMLAGYFLGYGSRVAAGIGSRGGEVAGHVARGYGAGLARGK
jgi:hypothetical protein